MAKIVFWEVEVFPKFYQTTEGLTLSYDYVYTFTFTSREEAVNAASSLMNGKSDLFIHVVERTIALSTTDEVQNFIDNLKKE